MNGAYIVMFAFYALMVVLLITANVRVRGVHWRTSERWIAAGWAAYVVGLVFFIIGMAS